MEEKNFDALAHVRGLLGMVVGGVAGFFVFRWLVSQGFYALALPGAMMGMACGYASRIRSPALAIACGISGAVVTVFAEWNAMPFVADESLAYFLTHMHQLKGLTLIMLALGIVFAAWFGLGRPNQLR
jgi:hypothetical protein